MLKLLSKVPGVNRGIGLATSSGSLSDLFLQLHYCSTFLAMKKRVAIVSSHLVEWNYRTIFSKLALRWDPSLITIAEIDNILENSLCIKEEDIVKSLEQV
uniref:AAA_8 domain-containing protein n=1 Tax=Angiostrongylus cantonensis TaxID=6313 RepID=A0A0K0DAU3_ANGCA